MILIWDKRFRSRFLESFSSKRDFNSFNFWHSSVNWWPCHFLTSSFEHWYRIVCSSNQSSLQYNQFLRSRLTRKGQLTKYPQVVLILNGKVTSEDLLLKHAPFGHWISIRTRRSSNESKKWSACIVPFFSEPPLHASMNLKFKAASQRIYKLSCSVEAKHILCCPNPDHVSSLSTHKSNKAFKKNTQLFKTPSLLRPCLSMCTWMSSCRHNKAFAFVSFVYRGKSCSSSEYGVLHPQTFTVNHHKRLNANFWVEKMHKSRERDFIRKIL